MLCNSCVHQETGKKHCSSEFFNKRKWETNVCSNRVNRKFGNNVYFDIMRCDGYKEKEVIKNE